MKLSSPPTVVPTTVAVNAIIRLTNSASSHFPNPQYQSLRSCQKLSQLNAEYDLTMKLLLRGSASMILMMSNPVWTIASVRQARNPTQNSTV